MDNFRRKLALKHEFKKRILRFVMKDTGIKPVYKYNALLKMSMMPHLGSHSKIRNRCVISGRSYCVQKKTRYCRFVFRHNAYFANLPGVRRSS